MNKQEFLKILADALHMELSSEEVTQNIVYYDGYVTDEIRKGRTEQDVIDSLGDPRMIAKSILEASYAAKDASHFYQRETYDEAREENSNFQENRFSRSYDNSNFEYRHNGKCYSISGKVAAIIAVIAIIFILSLLLWIVGGILRLLLPILLPVLLILFGIRLLRRDE